MHHFFVTDIQSDQAEFSSEQAHQIGRVLRLPVGARVVVLDNAGWQYEAELVAVGRRVTAVLHHKQPAANEPASQITLFQALLKRDNFEWVLQKGTEIGVTRFVPLITERAVAHPPNKSDRWQRILTEAAEQSRRGRIPEIAPPLRLADAWQQAAAADIALLPWEGTAAETIGTVLGTMFGGKRPSTIALFIGPEGGWTEAEVANGRAHNAIPVTLGPRILRAETAAVVSAALIMQFIGEWG
ncbi:MAG: 16S rRNA (uracil(1498)-N(3))-methyltransferase [Chloroflexi bacterium]|nr:16S rRNA (uracil(1498)-N(3))-methyltransferase [Chloroflexota bacterium]